MTQLCTKNEIIISFIAMNMILIFGGYIILA